MGAKPYTDKELVYMKRFPDPTHAPLGISWEAGKIRLERDRWLATIDELKAEVARAREGYMNLALDARPKMPDRHYEGAADALDDYQDAIREAFAAAPETEGA